MTTDQEQEDTPGDAAEENIENSDGPSEWQELYNLYKRELAIREKAFGPAHPEVGDSLCNLAWVHFMQGQYALATALFNRALEIYEKTLGPDHPNVIRILEWLELVYITSHQYDQAELLHQHTLEVREKKFGPDHPLVGATLDDLVCVYFIQRRYAQAEPVARRALALWEKTLNPNDVRLADKLLALAAICRNADRVEEANAFEKRVEVMGAPEDSEE